MQIQFRTHANIEGTLDGPAPSVEDLINALMKGGQIKAINDGTGWRLPETPITNVVTKPKYGQPKIPVLTAPTLEELHEFGRAATSGVTQPVTTNRGLPVLTSPTNADYFPPKN